MKNFRAILILAMVVALVAFIASAQETTPSTPSTPSTPNPNCPIQRTKNFINGMMERMRSTQSNGMSSMSSTSNVPSGEHWNLTNLKIKLYVLIDNTEYILMCFFIFINLKNKNKILDRLLLLKPQLILFIALMTLTHHLIPNPMTPPSLVRSLLLINIIITKKPLTMSIHQITQPKQTKNNSIQQTHLN